MKTVILVILGGLAAGVGFFLTAYALATLSDARRRRRQVGEPSSTFRLPMLAMPDYAVRKHPTIYDEMMADPENAEALLVDRNPFPEDIYRSPKSQGAQDQSTIDNATEFRRDFA